MPHSNSKTNAQEGRAHILVVKIGTNTLVRQGAMDERYLQDLAAQVAALHAQHRHVVVVSSGAIRCGLNVLGRERAVRLPEKQAAAAIGQSLVMRAYRRAFAVHGLHVAQILLTREDLADRRRFLNARNTFHQLFKWNVVPIVNENDTVATEEIKFGENDTLAARTALVAESELVLLLSDVDGFYLPEATTPIPTIAAITPAIQAAAGGAGSAAGSGGMRTKLEAARIAMHSGIELVIADGRLPQVLLRIAQGEPLGTRFTVSRKLRGRKRWIAFGRRPQGTLLLQDKARPAIVERGSSVLPVGICGVEGTFEAGALVSIGDARGEFARGLSNYSALDLRRIAGLHSHELAGVLGQADYQEAVHRDNLVLMPEAGK